VRALKPACRTVRCLALTVTRADDAGDGITRYELRDPGIRADLAQRGRQGRIWMLVIAPSTLRAVSMCGRSSDRVRAYVHWPFSARISGRGGSALMHRTLASRKIFSRASINHFP